MSREKNLVYLTAFVLQVIQESVNPKYNQSYLAMQIV